MKLKFGVALLAFVTAVIPLSLFAESSLAQAVASRDAARTYANLPLRFEPAAEPGHFLARSGGYAVLVGAGESAIAINDAKSGSTRTLRFRFDDSNATAQIEAIEPLPGVTNYYIGQDPNNWRLGVRNFAKLRTKDVYPGVDVVYYGDQRRLEFDFVVAPMADPRPIALTLSGMDKLYVNADGELVAEVNGQPVRFAKPYAYQKVAGSTKAVSVEYALAGEGKAQLQIGDYDKNLELVIDPTLTYSTYLGGSGADTANGIAVDANGNAYITGQTCSSNFPATGPTSFAGNCDAYVSKLAFNSSTNATTLVFTTFFGGSNGTGNPASAVGNGIALDNVAPSPNIYVVGSTNFWGLPFAIAPYNGGDHDAFIVILRPDGTLLRSTYLGGSSDDEGYAIAVDSQQNVIVAGQTNSLDFPVYNGFQPKTEEYVAFATKLDFGLHIDKPSNTPPLLFGSSAMSPRHVSLTDTLCGNGALCPATANISAGSTYYFFSVLFGGQLVPPIATWPVAGGSYPTQTPTLVPYGAITWGTPYGCTPPVTPPVQYPPLVLFALGSGTSAGINWGVCTAGYPVNTTVPDYGGFNWLVLGPPVGAIYATTEAYGVALDPNDDVYVVGGSNTASLEPANYAWLPGMHYVGTGAWIIKVHGQDGGLVYATPLGTNVTDTTQTVNAARGIAVDASGRAYVVGTATGGIYTTTESIHPAKIGSASTSNAFILRMSESGSGIDYGTYLGGTGNDQGLGVAVDIGGWAYIIGSTQSADIPLINPVVVNPTNNTTLSQLMGTQDAYIAKITPDGTALIMSAYLGGSGVDQGNAIALSPNATSSGTMDITVAGTTTSQDFPVVNALAGQTTAPGNGDAFVTKILGTSFPMVTVSPTSVGFGDQAVGFSSSTQPVTITNTGQVPLTINSFETTGDFTWSNSTCGTPPAQIVIGGACTIAVTFTPTQAMSRSGTLTISDNAINSPQGVGLQGNGVLVQDSVSPLTLSFPSTALGTTSAALTVTVQNTDPKQTLIISSSPVIGGNNASDFAVSSNTCTTNLTLGQSCTFGVTFTPTAPGSRIGTLIINGNGNTFPATVSLTGVGNGAGSIGSAGADFTLTPSSTSLAVTPGTAATFTVTLNPSSLFTGTVQLACTPTGGATCSISPASITVVSGTTSYPATVTVNIPAGSTVTVTELMRPGRLLATLLPFGGIGLVLAGRRRRWLLLLGLAVWLALGMMGCGGSSSSSSSQTPKVTITATSQSGSVQAVVPLSVSSSSSSSSSTI